ncbi:DNA-directed RNA polymerase subunit B'' [Candidatus Woesearchaeota archaeon]|nr:DNA-directed RNA polymerase subunit B'' [Candidatus Woesearchaeota archaeon]
MSRKFETLIKSHFLKRTFVSSDIESYNNFINFGLSKIITELEDIEPTIIPHDIDELKIKFDNIRVAKPMIVEADGSERKILPREARLRNISYAATVYIDVSTHINGVQRESFTTNVGRLPVMLKSDICHLKGMSREELIESGEDPNDPGGYFIINGTERVLIDVEDLASNKFFIEKPTVGTSEYVGKLFSQRGSYRIPHKVEKPRDGIFYLSFTRVQRIPLMVIIKALGLLKDEEITHFVSSKEDYEEVLINLYNFTDVKTEEDALDFIAKKLKSTKPKEIRIQRMRETLDKYLLPHLGITKEDRIYKAYNLCKMIKKFIKATRGEVLLDDKDHYANKRLKLSGDLLEDLFRTNLKSLVKDLLYNFQRIVKRGKFPSIKVIIRDKLLTNSIYSAMATGNWVGGRKGISQRLQRINNLEIVSHLQRVVSPLSPSQENFEARALHSTHLGRLCPIETPDGTNIGLRKNLSLLASVSQGVEDSEKDKILENLRNLGLRSVR